MTDVNEAKGWARALDELMGRLGPRFGRVEPRRRALAYLRGLLAPVERKNGWQLAEAAGDRTPDGMQDFLGRMRWDADAVRDDLRAYVVEHLGDPGAVLVLDETGFVKKGDEVGGRAAAVQRHRGPRRELPDRRLPRLRQPPRPGADRPRALPARGLGGRSGPPRRGRRAGGGRLHHQAEARARRCWSGRWTPACRARGWRATASTGPTAPCGGGSRRAAGSATCWRVTSGQRLGGRRVDAWAAGVPPEGWHRLSAGEGGKGPRLYDWAYLPYRGGAPAGWAKGLLVRRKLDEPDELAFHLTLAPEGTDLATLVRVAGTRWTIEACFEAAKGEVGLDEYEVRSWTGWHRHVTLAMLAHAYLAAVRKAAVGGRAAARPGRGPAAADRARGAPAALAPALGAQPRSGGRARLVALATPPPAARPPLPLATPDRLP